MSSSYSPAPFWFLNHRLEEREIKRQIKLMSEAGVSGFFIHPRAGLLTPYGSEQWFIMVEYIIREAKKLGLKVWLYDEDPYSSGIAGGRVVFDNPEYAARKLEIICLVPDKTGAVCKNLGQGRVLSALALKINKKGNITDIRDVESSIGVIRPFFLKTSWNNSYYSKTPYAHFRAETFYPELQIDISLKETNWKVYISIAKHAFHHGKHGLRPDNLNKDCVKKFIEYTHEKYAALFGSEFGHAIPGIFIDEPYIGGNLPWTPALEHEFFKRKGYHIEKNYHHLIETFDNTSGTVRYDYWDIVHSMYKENFFGQIATWCRKNSLKLCGHVICEEDPIGQVIAGGNAFAYQRFFDIPGFDHVTPNIADRKHPSLNFGGKLISSTAHQQNKPRILSECFGANAFNFGQEGMYKIANWLFSLGITWLVPHGFHYSYDGDRKFDAGKSFFFQDPLFPEFKKISAYANNIGKKLAQSEHMCNTCLLYPVALFWEFLPAEMMAAEKLRTRLYQITQLLLEEHVEFDIIDDHTLFHTPIKNGKIQCGMENYSVLVIPQIKDLSEAYLKKIKALERKSITIIEGIPAKKSLKTAGLERTQIERFSNSLYNSNPRDLMCLRKKQNNNIVLYIFNNSRMPGMFSIPCIKDKMHCYLYDARNNKYFSMTHKKNRIPFAIGGYEAVILEFRKDSVSTTQLYCVPLDLKPVTFDYEKNPEWFYSPPMDCISSIHQWNISLKSPGFQKKIKSHSFCLMRNVAWTELTYIKERSVRPGFDTVRERDSLYPLKAIFQAEFSFSQNQIKDKSDIFFVCECDTFQGEYKILINGKNLPKKSFTRKTVYDPFNLVAKIGELIKPDSTNNISIIWPKANEFDGLKSSIYIMEID
ncbi:hypothetical protein KKC91_07630 [bacterium]|nr:hypothetical protein [bacterium]